jgi:hypothetical protein
MKVLNPSRIRPANAPILPPIVLNSLNKIGAETAPLTIVPILVKPLTMSSEKVV